MALIHIGKINTILQEIALKLQENTETQAKDWLKYKHEIYLKLMRIFKETDRTRIDQLIDIFCRKQQAKDEMNHLSELLFNYIQRNVKNFADYRDGKNPEVKDLSGQVVNSDHSFVEK